MKSEYQQSKKTLKLSLRKWAIPFFGKILILLAIGNGVFSIAPVYGQVVTVPNVVGLSETVARPVITNAGLTVGTVNTFATGTVPPGTVLNQSPTAGTNVGVGSGVDLVVAQGIIVPGVVGLNQAAAQISLTTAGLTLGTITMANSPSIPIGVIISQSPNPGINVAPGSPVAVVVSLGAAVPNVIGSTQAVAQTTLTSAGLTLGTVSNANSPTVPIGRVISQSPTAGNNVAPGSAVALVISLGAKVPNVVGSTQTAAQGALTTAGLTVGTVTNANSATVAIGRVISQSPAAGNNVAPGSAVNLVVSVGITVPNVVGNTQTAAQTALSNTGLTVGTVTNANSATVAIGRVISQSPAAGNNVDPGSAVALVISLGAKVPNVVGSTQGAAQSALSSAGLSVGTVTNTNSTSVTIGRVISQSPQAGNNVPPGSKVNLVVSLGAKVPNVVGSTQAAAQTALTNAGLTVGTVTNANSANVPIGRVISQSPTAGTNAAPGSAVALVISLGIKVPNVVGSTQTAAQSTLTTVGLTMGPVTSANSPTVAIGRVISQTPTAGTNVAAGSTVALVISLGAKVPDVVGSPQATAQTALTNAGLTVGTVTNANSANVPIGRVISQSPQPGNNVGPGSAVNLVVSIGIKVPNVVGSAQGAAQTALTNAGLTLGSVTSANSPTVPIGSVINQNPAAGSNVAAGSTVALVVSLGAKVPDVVGSPQATAQTALTNAGLTVGTLTNQNSATVAIGAVISQTPKAGTNVSPRSAVNLVVSLGINVPNVVGNTQAAAQTALTTAGLKVGTVTSANSPTVPIGRVSSQTPAAGSNVAAGSGVALVVSLGAKVPDIVGNNQTAAQSALTNAGLQVGTVTSANSPTVPIGRVISQNPAAGSNVAPDSAVSLVVSLGAKVPNVVGSTQAAALTALTNAGLKIGSVTNPNSATVAIGAVISQSPDPDTNVAPGSAVNLVISVGPPAFLMGVQNDPNTGPLVNSLYRIRTDGVVTKIGDLDHRTHGLAFVGATLYSVEEQTLSTPGTPPKLYTVNRQTGVTGTSLPLSLSTGEAVEGGVGLATHPETNQLWGLLIVLGEGNHFRRLVTINPATGLATQIAKIPGRFVDMAFDPGGTLYVMSGDRPDISGSAILPARIYTVNTSTGAAAEFLDVSAGAVAGQPNFRESETIGMGPTANLLYHLSGQHKVTPGFTKNILFESIHLTTKVRTAIPITGPDFFVTTALTSLPSTASPTQHDLDGNGQSDLVWRHTLDGSVALWLMNGVSIAASAFPAGVPLNWRIAGIGDITGDGKADVIWREGSSGTVAVWVMDGLTITGVGFPGGTSTDWRLEKVGDLNGDGRADLIWRNTTDGSVALWLMNGVTIAASGFPSGVPLTWQVAGVGDVTGDGKADVIWRESGSGLVAVWVMNGLSITGVGFPGSTALEWEMTGLGDVNGDRKADLVWHNRIDGSIVIWLMNGATLSSSGGLGELASDLEIEQVDDTNGDGRADLIIRNKTTGEVSVSFLDGLRVLGSGSAGRVSVDWEIQD